MENDYIQGTMKRSREQVETLISHSAPHGPQRQPHPSDQSEIQEKLQNPTNPKKGPQEDWRQPKGKKQHTTDKSAQSRRPSRRRDVTPPPKRSNRSAPLASQDPEEEVASDEEKAPNKPRGQSTGEKASEHNEPIRRIPLTKKSPVRNMQQPEDKKVSEEGRVQAETLLPSGLAASQANP